MLVILRRSQEAISVPKNVPMPIAAALGIVPSVVDSAKRLPSKAVQIPVLAVSSALTALESARREYDDLVVRGEQVVARLRGQSLDHLEDWAEALVEDTPLAKPSDAGVQAGVEAPKPPAELPKGQPTAPAPSGSPEPVETAASPQVVQTVEAVTAAAHVPPVTSHDQLPLADYDHLTLGALRGRLRSLSLEELVQIRDYEKAHAHRLPVVTLLDNRIAKLATDAAATPSAGGGAVVTPPAATAPKVARAAEAKTAGPTRTKVRIT